MGVQKRKKIQKMEENVNFEETADQESAEISLYLTKLDTYIHSDDFVKEMLGKFNQIKMKSFDKSLKDIYLKGENIKNYNTENIYEWHNKTSSMLIVRLLKYIDYFLTSGPLTRSEHKMFRTAVSLLKSYYFDRFNYLINSENKREIIANTVYPMKNTSVYTLFFSQEVTVEKTTLYYD
ncbi:hypothetical protein NUSPORA_00508 [Nucleospora cyclopteri]